jgi:hypothetical protein
MVIKRQRTRLSFLWRAVGKHCCHAAFVRRRLDWRYDGLIRRADCMWRAVKPVIRQGLAQACQVTYVSQSIPVGAGVLDFDSLYLLFLNSPSTALQTEIQHPLAYLVTKLVYQG